MSENTEQAAADGQDSATVSNASGAQVNISDAAAKAKAAVVHGNPTIVAAFETARDKTERLMNFLDKQLDVVGDVTVQEEVAKAREYFELGRMRLGVALTYHKGFDPWSSKSGRRKK